MGVIPFPGKKNFIGKASTWVYSAKMKPIVQMFLFAMILMLCATTMGDDRFRGLTGRCMHKCWRVTVSWGKKLKTPGEIIKCEDVCDLFKVGSKVVVQAIQYGVTNWTD